MQNCKHLQRREAEHADNLHDAPSVRGSPQSAQEERYRVRNAATLAMSVWAALNYATTDPEPFVGAVSLFGGSAGSIANKTTQT